MTMPLMLRLDDPRALDPNLVGGKAASLARLRQAGFPVLPGCCLTTEGLATMLAQASPGANDAAFRWNVELACLPPELLRLLRAELEALGTGSGGVFVVRSSAVGEDGDRRAFAGIHASFVHVEAAGVPRAVSRCWASLFSPRATAYRRSGGIGDRPAGGVLVQPMLANAVVGVAFTCDPLTGSPDRVVVEPLPRDGSPPVPFTFLRVEGEGASVELVAVTSFEEGNGHPGGERDAAQVARLALRVEAFFGAPRDVEWARTAEGPVILQARPVTVRPAPGPQRAVWSNGNLKEIFPSPLTPLTRSLVARGVRRAWAAYYAQIGFRLPPDLELFGLFGGRLYFNFAAFQQILFDLYGIHPREENLNMGGHQPEAFRPEARRTPWSVRLRRPLYMWRTRRQFAGLPRRAARECQEIEAWIGQRRRIRLERVSDAELVRLFAELEEFSLPKAALHLLASHAAGMIHHLEGLIRRWLGPDRWQDINELLTGLEQVKSAELAQAVLSLAALAQRDPHCRAFFTARAWIRKDVREALAGSPFLEALETFLVEYGHRGVEELELASRPWREEPSMLFEAIRQHVQADAPIDAAGAAALRRRRREAATQRVLAALAEGTRLSRLGLRRRIFRGVLGEVQTSTGIRELTKHHVVMLQDEARRLCREAGRRLAAAGLLDSPDDVFFLEGEEMFAWLGKGEGGPELRDRVAGRRAERDRLLRLRVPDAIAAAPRGVAERDGGPRGGRYRGIPVSAGSCRGVARILSHPSEVHRLARGDILVVSALDPAWTVALLLAGGIVAEVGGVLSHAAIVARELGVPAVVNVAGVTRAVRDGDMIEVDGGRGEVACLPSSAPGIG